MDGRRRYLRASFALAALCACTASRSHESTARQDPNAATPAPEPKSGGSAAAWKDGTSVLSNAGRYRIVYVREAAEWPRGKTFGLRAWVFDARDETRPLEDVALAVDAAMPDHLHGMNRTPRIHGPTGGRHDVEGVLFHMPGYWELYFDVSRGAHVERAQIGIELE